MPRDIGRFRKLTDNEPHNGPVSQINMNNPFDYSPSPNCEKAFRFLLAKLELLTLSKRREDINLSHELREGKMLGVMIAEDKSGRRQFLFAFSGQLGAFGFLHPLFVPPVFDSLPPDG